ncbi:MAG: hypothetical protein IPG32_01160 [Saprospirales bacterium]|nr:hypothetical protein [Saprospirales bacterium]
MLSYLWTGPGLLSGDSTLNPLIDSSGVYCLEVSHIYQGVSCSDLACVTVTSINDPPEQPALAGPSGACLGTSSEYTVAPSGSGLPAAGFTWTVTGGTFTTNTNGDTIAVMWTAAGQGQVCVTADNANGSSLQNLPYGEYPGQPHRDAACPGSHLPGRQL